MNILRRLADRTFLMLYVPWVALHLFVMVNSDSHVRHVIGGFWPFNVPEHQMDPHTGGHGEHPENNLHVTVTSHSDIDSYDYTELVAYIFAPILLFLLSQFISPLARAPGSSGNGGGGTNEGSSPSN